MARLQDVFPFVRAAEQSASLTVIETVVGRRVANAVRLDDEDDDGRYDAVLE